MIPVLGGKDSGNAEQQRLKHQPGCVYTSAMKRKNIARSIFLVLLLALLAWLTACTAQANREISRDEVLDFETLAPGDFYRINGFSIHVRTLGAPAADPTGIPLLMLHGFGPAGSSVWARFAEDELAAQRSLILPDFLGMGYSERVTSPGRHYTIAGQAGMIADLLDEMGIEQVDLLGHSYGGAVSAQFALDYPEKVRRLVLLDAQIFENRIGQFFQSLGALPFGIGRAITWNSLGGGSTTFQAFCGEVDPCELAQVVLVRGTVDALQAINDTEQVSRLPEDLPLIDRPVTVIWGSEDQIVAIEDGRRLADTMGVELQVIEGGSHTPFFDAPGTTAEKILGAFTWP